MSSPETTDVKSTVKSMFSSKKFFIIIALLGLFIGAAFYVYNTYVAPKLNPSFVSNREFTNDSAPESKGTAEIYFIYAKWCPHSKKVMPVWDVLKDKYDGKLVNQYPVIFKEFDGDTQEKEIDDFSKNFNKKIDGYPTIIIVKGNEVIEFDANPTQENLEEFLNTTL